MKLDYPKTIKVGLAFAIIMVFWSAYEKDGRVEVRNYKRRK